RKHRIPIDGLPWQFVVAPVLFAARISPNRAFLQRIRCLECLDLLLCCRRSIDIRVFRCHSGRINKLKGIIEESSIHIGTVYRARRVIRDPSAQPWSVVSHCLITQPAFLVSFFACKPVSFATKTAKASLSVRKEFFSIDKGVGRKGCSSDHKIAAPQMVAEMILNYGSFVVRVDLAISDNRHSALIIHHMTMVV